MAIEEDFKQVKEIDTKLEALNKDRKAVLDKYTEVDEEVGKAALDPIYLSASALAKHIRRGLKALGTVKVNYGKPRSDYATTTQFRIQEGSLFSHSCRGSWGYTKLIDTLINQGPAIASELKNEEMKRSFLLFHQWIVAHASDLKNAKADRHGTPREVQEVVLTFTEPKRIVLMTDRQTHGYNESNSMREFGAVSMSLGAGYGRDSPSLIFKDSYGNTLSVKPYRHVVQQVEPQVFELIKLRLEKKEQECKLEKELAEKVDEWFRKWLVLQQI